MSPLKMVNIRESVMNRVFIYCTPNLLHINNVNPRRTSVQTRTDGLKLAIF